MRRASAALVTAIFLFMGFATACEADGSLLSSGFARVELDGTVLATQSAGLADVDGGAGREWTIRALTDEEIAFLMRDAIDPRWNKIARQENTADRDPFAMAAAFGSALQRLARFWDPRLASVLLWLCFVAVMVRPPRTTQAKGQN